MAEEQKSGASQFELGKLFVDIGSRGLGGLVKGLNTLSAQFLLTKNSAQQAIKPIIDMSQNAASSVVEWDKLRATMGLSYKQIQEIARFTEQNNIPFHSYMAQLKGIQQKIIDIKTGMSNDFLGFTMLGLNPRDFDPNNPLQLLDAIKEKVKDIDTVTAAAALRWFGLDDNLLYVWERQNDKLNERLNLTDEEIGKLLKQQDAWNSLRVTWEAAQQKFIANQGLINRLLEGTTQWLADEHPYLQNLSDTIEKMLNALVKYKTFERLLFRGSHIGSFFLDSLNKDTRNAIKKMTPEQQERFNKIRQLQDNSFNKQMNEVIQNLAVSQNIPANNLNAPPKETPSLNSISVPGEYSELPAWPKYATTNNAPILPQSIQNEISNKDIKFDIINNYDLDIQTIPGDPDQIGQEMISFVAQGQMLAINNMNQVAT